MHESNTARLDSLDALRGLDMLIILGVDALVYCIYAECGGNGFWRLAREQLGHAPWEGLRVYDCVFPLFVFIAGVSMCFSQLRQAGKPAARVLGKLWRRAIVLVLLGLLVNGAITWEPGQMRYASVLGLIGLSGALAGSFTLFSHGKMLPGLALAALILGGVGAAQHLGGNYTPSGCFNAKVDALLCPGILHSGSYDPEGPLCIVSATALSLLGCCAGRLFLLVERAWLRGIVLMASGGLLLACGWFLPCIKGIWTPGFVLCCAGIGAISLGGLHLVIDVLRWRAWSLPLRVVGMNALAAYMVVHLVSFSAIAQRLLGGTWALFLSPGAQRIATAATALLLVWWLCWFLYRKRAFIKL